MANRPVETTPSGSPLRLTAMSPTSARRLFLGLVVFGVFAPLATKPLDRGLLETCLVISIWLCWMLLPMLFAFSALRFGFIEVRGTRTYRAKEPARFWTGLFTLEALLIAFAILASMGLAAYFFPARP
jgi:hypothetical protein